MNGFRVLATNHTSFTVSDLDRACAFFTEALGFEVISRAPRNPALIESITGVEGADIMVAYVQMPGHRLELIEYLAPEARGRVESRPCDTGFAHLAFDVDNLDAALAAAQVHSVRPIGEPTVIDKGPNTGNRVVYLRDVDGITIEFIEKPA
ncbi:MAG: VOC family protein [Alphaproteobacteria bacterium]|jgi:catechol 2,3-dioxygenase-like lactoylglutathione lyase family enzyme|nr:VOC family protein [Alphaproteobacteria bacterium]